MQTRENPHVTEAQYQEALRAAERYARGRMRTARPEIAEELVGECALAAHRALLGYRPGHGTQWSSYAFGMVKLIPLERVRRAARRQGRLQGRRLVSLDAPMGEGERLADAVVGPDDPAAEVLALMDREEAAALVARVLRCLSPRQREVLRLRRLEGLTQAETAARLGVCANTVAQAERRALERARVVCGVELPADHRPRDTRRRDAQGRIVAEPSHEAAALLREAEALHAAGLSWSRVAARLQMSLSGLMARRARARQAQERP